MGFVNKMDRQGSDFLKVCQQIKDMLKSNAHSLFKLLISRGIGKGIVYKLVENGANVAFTYSSSSSSVSNEIVNDLASGVWVGGEDKVKVFYDYLYLDKKFKNKDQANNKKIKEQLEKSINLLFFVHP